MIFTFSEWHPVNRGWERVVEMAEIPIAIIRLVDEKDHDGHVVRTSVLLVPEGRNGEWVPYHVPHTVSADFSVDRQKQAAVHYALVNLPGWVSEELTKSIREDEGREAI